MLTPSLHCMFLKPMALRANLMTKYWESARSVPCSSIQGRQRGFERWFHRHGKVRKCIPTSAIWPTVWTIPPGKAHIANLYSAAKQHTRMQRQHLRVENKLLNIPNPDLRWFKVECRTAKIFGLDNKFPRVPSLMAMCRISLALLHSRDTRDYI